MKSNFKKAVYILLGSLSLGAGTIGIIIPGLPTVPFLLLTAVLYVKSSRRLYRWLISNAIFGPSIRGYRDNKGLTRRHKIIIIIIMWTMVIVSAGFLISNPVVKIVVIIAGGIGTLVVARLVPLARDKKHNPLSTYHNRARSLPDHGQTAS